MMFKKRLTKAKNVIEAAAIAELTSLTLDIPQRVKFIEFEVTAKTEYLDDIRKHVKINVFGQRWL
jgi:hypothetical protein